MSPALRDCACMHGETLVDYGPRGPLDGKRRSKAMHAMPSTGSDLRLRALEQPARTASSITKTHLCARSALLLILSIAHHPPTVPSWAKPSTPPRRPPASSPAPPPSMVVASTCRPPMMRRLMRTTRDPAKPPLQRSRRRRHPSPAPHPQLRRSRQEPPPSRRRRRSTAASPRPELSALSPLCEFATSRSPSSHFTLSFLSPPLCDPSPIADTQHYHAQRQEHQGRLCRLHRGEQTRS